MALKTYGENYYKGFVLLKNKKNNKVTKHYISAVDPSYLGKGTVNLYVRNASGDSMFQYKMGTSRNVDIGIKTWVAERRKKKRRVSGDLPKACYSFLRKTKR